MSSGGDVHGPIIGVRSRVRTKISCVVFAGIVICEPLLPAAAPYSKRPSGRSPWTCNCQPHSKPRSRSPELPFLNREPSITITTQRENPQSKRATTCPSLLAAALPSPQQLLLLTMLQWLAASAVLSGSFHVTSSKSPLCSTTRMLASNWHLSRLDSQRNDKSEPLT